MHETVTELRTAEGESRVALQALGEAMHSTGGGLLIGTSVDPATEGYLLCNLSQDMVPREVGGEPPRDSRVLPVHASLPSPVGRFPRPSAAPTSLAPLL